MKKNFITIILIALVILNIVDGDFKNPSTLDYIKFIILSIAIILNMIASAYSRRD